MAPSRDHMTPPSDPLTTREADYPPLMREQLAALLAYAQDHGAGWKVQLRKDWLGPLLDPLLAHLQSSHGAVWLSRFEFPA
jgi:hypothetical protein